MVVVFIPDRIKLARQSRGLSQVELAKMVKVSSQQLSEWEIGKVKPGVDKLAKIMTALETPPTFFFASSGANGAKEVHQTKERRGAP